MDKLRRPPKSPDLRFMGTRGGPVREEINLKVPAATLGERITEHCRGGPVRGGRLTSCWVPLTLRTSLEVVGGEFGRSHGAQRRTQSRLGARWDGLFWALIFGVLGRPSWRCVRQATGPGGAALRRLHISARTEAISGCQELIYVAACPCLCVHPNLVSTPSPRPGTLTLAPGRVRHLIAWA